MTRQEVYEALDSEREYQKAMWPGDGGTIDNPLAVGEHLVLIRTYLRKAEDAWQNESKPCVKTLDMIRKIGGIVVNCGEQNGMPKRGEV